MKMKLAQYIAEFLANHEIENIFTVTGGGAMHLNDAFGHCSKLHCLYHHHEQACAIAAEAYSRYSNRLAVVCVTSGPGGTNAITGVLGGWLDSIPMFIISGQVKRETTIWATAAKLRQLGDQEYNIVASVAPMTKYAHMIVEPNEIRYHLEKALFLAMHGRGGPVWLDIPLDVQAAIVETDHLEGFDPAECVGEEPVYDESMTNAILEKLKLAKRPVLFAGTGIRLSGAYDLFLALIERLQIPVVTAWNAHDLLWDENPLFCGRPGTLGTRGGNFIVQNSDLLLVLGCRLNIRQISYNYKQFAPDAYKIIVDVDAEELKKPTVHADMPVHANVRDVMQALYDAPLPEKSTAHEAWLRWARDINQEYPAVLPAYYDKQTPVNPYVFMDKLFRHLNEGDTIVTGNGSACVISFQAAKIKRGQRLFTNSGCAAMGYGFPAAIGACVSKKGRVYCIDGDGSFQMNIQEMQTVVYNQLDIKILYLNNNGYHSIRQTQTNLFQPPLVGVCDGNGLSFPDMEKVSSAYGIPYLRIDRLDEIDDQLIQMEAIHGPVLCEIILDPAQNFEPKLSSRVLPDGRIVSPPIDDMYPFLDRDEYMRNKNLSAIGEDRI